jgi:outer membrane protein TolC
MAGELKKHLVWGTDLSLRVEGSQQRSVSTFTNVASNPPTTTQLAVGPNWGALVRLSATQPLLRGAGRDVAEAQLDVARVNRVSAASSRDRTASQLLVDALGAYWELYYASRALDIQRKSLELARAQRDETEARVRTGSLAPVERLTFDTRIATLEEDVAKAEAEELDRSTELARQLGDAGLTQRRADTSRTPSTANVPTGDLRGLALTASYDVVEQEQAVRLAEVQAKTAADSLRPRLDLEGYVQAQGLGARAVSPALDQVGSLRAVSAHVGLVYELPLDTTQRRAERDRADLAIDAARKRLDATKQKVTADVDTAVRKDETARKRIALAEQSLEIARRQLDAETARFRTGSSTALQVREAEDQVRSAELRAARASVDLAIAHQQIAHLTGRLLAERAK